MRGTQRQCRVFDDLRDIDRDRDDQQPGERSRRADFGDEEIMPSFDGNPLVPDRAQLLRADSLGSTAIVFAVAEDRSLIVGAIEDEKLASANVDGRIARAGADALNLVVGGAVGLGMAMGLRGDCADEVVGKVGDVDDAVRVGRECRGLIERSRRAQAVRRTRSARARDG